MAFAPVLEGPAPRPYSRFIGLHRALQPFGMGVARASRSLVGGLRVVLYHHLAARPTDLVDEVKVATDPELFEAHLVQLAKNYEIVDLDQVLSGQLPKRALLITFDDGYRSVLDVGGPVLRRLRLPSVFFVSAAFVSPEHLPLDNLLSWLVPRVGLGVLEEALAGTTSTGRSFDDLITYIAALPYRRFAELGERLAERFEVDRAAVRQESDIYLRSDELRHFADFDCEIGNHTESHVFCRAIADRESADFELVEHKRRLEAWTGRAVRAFSYPYGYRADATAFVEEVLESSGHEASFLVESRPNRSHRKPGAWNRVSLHDQATSTLGLELEVLPRLRAAKDRLGAVSVRG